MDLYNNEIGRQIGMANPDASPQELADLVESAVRDGDTVIVTKDGAGVTWSDDPALTPGPARGRPQGCSARRPDPLPH